MKKIRITRSIFLVALICLLSLALCSCAMLDDAAKLQAYDFGSDQIPSLNSVVGERKVTGMETGSRTGGVKYKNYTYATQTQTEDMDAYYAALKGAGFLVTTASEGDMDKGSLGMGCNSADEGQMILINISWDNGSITVQTAKGEGDVTPN